MEKIHQIIHNLSDQQARQFLLFAKEQIDFEEGTVSFSLGEDYQQALPVLNHGNFSRFLLHTLAEEHTIGNLFKNKLLENEEFLIATKNHRPPVRDSAFGLALGLVSVLAFLKGRIKCDIKHGKVTLQIKGQLLTIDGILESLLGLRENYLIKKSKNVIQNAKIEANNLTVGDTINIQIIKNDQNPIPVREQLKELLSHPKFNYLNNIRLTELETELALFKALLLINEKELQVLTKINQEIQLKSNQETLEIFRGLNSQITLMLENKLNKPYPPKINLSSFELKQGILIALLFLPFMPVVKDANTKNPLFKIWDKHKKAFD